MSEPAEQYERQEEREEQEEKVEQLSLIRGDPLYRLQRAVGLIPAEGMGVLRRAVFFALLTWLPIAVWALLKQRALRGAVDEPLLQHFGVHVRCLLAIPLLIIAEGHAHRVTRRIMPQFIRADLVDHNSFVRVANGIAALRNRTLPWLLILVLVVMWTIFRRTTGDAHELLWAVQAPDRPSLGFGGWWYVFVARPIYVMLIFGWLWRVVLLTLLLRRLAKMELRLDPSHSDRLGGLGFLTALPAVFSLVVLALSTVAASGWGHDVMYHGAALQSLRVPAVAFVLVMLALFLFPVMAFTPVLARTKRRALLQYAALVGRHGRAVHERWIEGKDVREDALLQAPELGPVVDVIAIYDAVEKMRPSIVGKAGLLAILLPAILPMILVVAIKVPVKTLLLGVLKAVT